MGAPNTQTQNNIIKSPDSGDGYMVGPSSTSLIGFCGTTPIAQPSGNAQSALTRGQACGLIATFGTTQTPAAVAQGTTAEQTLTIQTGTGFTVQLATGDCIYVNKPTSQAGLGVGNVRVSSANTLGISYINVPAAGGNITPTASQNYSVVAIRGLQKTSLTISPASVAANTTVEQQFTCTGLPAGQLVQVSKPTVQAGLDIVGCRVISNNLLGITFINVTAAPIVPTASEVYTVNALGGMDAQNNEIMYGFNVGTVGAVGSGVVVTGGATTLTGLLATDVVAGIFKPTAQAAGTNNAIPAYGIPTADTLTLEFFGVGTGITPTASEVYGIRTIRLAPVAPLLLYSQAITPTSVAAATTAEQTFTCTGLISGSPVWVNKPTWQAGLGIAGVRISATDTLAITFINATAAAIVPNAETYLIGNFQVKNPGIGNVVYQTASPLMNNLANLSAAQRSALVSLGLMAGA